MPNSPVPPERPLGGRAAHATGTQSLFFSRRRRGHLAILIVLFAVCGFTFLLLRPRTVHVQADGRDLTIRTHISKDAVVLDQAGIDLQRGDRVTVLDGDGGDVLRIERAQPVRVTADGDVYELRTHATTIGQVLDELGIVMDDRDGVTIDGVQARLNAPLDAGGDPFLTTVRSTGVHAVEVVRAVRFTVRDGDREFVTSSSRPTVGLALREAGVVVGPGDEVLPGLDQPLVTGTVDVRHARPLTVTLPQGHQVLYTLASTVGEALADAGIAVPDGGFIDPPADTPIGETSSVRVVQLSASSDIEREYIESKTVYATDPSLAPGEVRREPGRDGVLVRRYDVSYVNGEEAGRTLAEEYYEVEPADTVVYTPPERPTRTVEAPPAGSARTLHVYATWYNAASSGRSPDDPSYGITATGVYVTYGVVAVDPTVIPLGTRMYIPGYGYGVAADTGGAVKGYIIDLGYPDGVDVDWRSGWYDIYILD